MLLRKLYQMDGFQCLILLILFLENMSFTNTLNAGCWMSDPENIAMDLWVVSSNNYSAFDAPQICLDQCQKLKFPFAFVELKTICHCSSDRVSEMTAVTNCTAKCLDGSECGGESQTIFTALEGTTSPTGVISLELDQTVFTVETTVPLRVTYTVKNYTGNLTVLLGDGLPVSLPISSEMYVIPLHKKTPGRYILSAYLDDFPMIHDNLEIYVVDHPLIDVQCPDILEVGIPKTCNVDILNQGYDTLYAYGAPPIVGTEIYDFPDENSFQIGVGSYGTDELAIFAQPLLSGTMILLSDSISFEDRYLTHIYTEAFSVGGSIGIYTVIPTCYSGTYCGILGMCTTSFCPEIVSETFSCETSFCPRTDSCAVNSVCSPTHEASKTGNSWTHVKTVLINDLVMDHKLLDEVKIPVGSKIAIGCLNDIDCPQLPKLLARNVTIHEHSDYLITAANPKEIVPKINYRYIFQLWGRTHPNVLLSQELICLQPSSIPNSAIEELDVAAAESYIFQSTSLFRFEEISHMGYLFKSNTSSIFCQIPVGIPELVTEVSIPVGKPFPFNIYFPSGSPIFNTIIMDGESHYHYWDDATNGWNYTFDLNYAVDGHYILLGNATNMNSSAEYNVTVHVIPEIQENWKIEFVCPCLNVTEGFTLNITMETASNPPWAANVTYKSNNVSFLALETVDFETEFNSGMAVPLNISRNVVFSTVGEQVVEITLSNEFSTVTINYTLLVEEGLANVNMTFQWLSEENDRLPPFGELEDSFWINTKIIVNISSSGTPESYSCSITETGENVTVLDPSLKEISFVIAENGQFTIVCGVYNSVQGWVYSPPKAIYTLFSELQGFNLIDSEMTSSENMTKEIWATFKSFPIPSCVIINFNDSISESYGNENLCKSEYPQIPFIRTALSSPVKVIHTFETENFYYVTGIAFDQINEFGAKVQIIAASIPCDLPTVVIANARELPTFPLLQYKSLPLGLQANAIINCNKTLPIKSFWTITEVDETTGASFGEWDISKLPTWNYSALQIEPRFLDYAVYKISYQINIFLSINVLKANAYTYVKIIKTPLLASLTNDGATKIIRGLGQRIEFNLTKSGDADDPIEISKLTDEMNMTIFCRRLSEEYSINIENDTFTGTEYQVIPENVPDISDGFGCFGKGLAPIKFTEQEFLIYTTAFISSPETYVFALQVSKDTRISTSILEVEVQNTAVPLISIQCANSENCIEHNGKKYINPTVRLSLAGNIESTDSTNLQYNWEAFDGEGNEIVILSSYCVPQTGMDCKKSSNLAVSENFFQDNNSTEEFVFRLNAIDGNGIPGLTEFVLTVNKPPVNGNCKLSRREGKVLISIYNIICVDWVDPESIGISSYTYSYILLGVENTIMKTILTTQETYVDLILPYGNMTIFVDIEDKLKSVTSVNLGNVVVDLPSQEEVELYDPDKKLRQYAINNDANAISQLIVSLNSIKENAEWLNLENFNDTEELTALKRKLSGDQQFQLKSAVETMTIETIQQMKVSSTILASVLESVFSNDMSATNLNLETKEYAASLTEKITLALKTITVSSPQELVPIIGNLIDSSTALICSSNLVVAIEEFSPNDLDNEMEYNTELDDDTIVSDSREGQLKSNVLDTTRERSKTQVDTIMETFHVLFYEIIRRVVRGEMVVSNSPMNATVIIGKFNEREFRKKDFILKSIFLEAAIEIEGDFCPTNQLNKNSDCDQEIEVKFIIWPCIPFYYPKTISHISTGARVVTLELYKNMQQIYMQNDTTFVITIPKETERIILPDLIILAVVDPLINMVYHKFSIDSSHTAFIIGIYAAEDTVISDNDVIYVHANRLPFPYDYLLAKRIIDLPLDKEGFYQLFFNTEDISPITNTYYIGIAKLKGLVTKNENLNKTLNDLSPIISLKYRMKTFSVGCFFYNKSTEEWSSEGLRVQSAMNGVVKCRSSHLSSFSIGYFPIPNSLDFEYIFANVGFIDNLTLYITLIIFICICLIVFIWSHYMDRRDIEKRGVIPLPDNKLGDKYLYEITFWTGPDKEASTNSNIMFIVSGDLEETEVRELPSKDRSLYRRYAVNSFVMSTKRPLGYINYLRVFHDNSGEPPLDSWQIQRAILRDIQTSEKFIFETNSWLALDRIDGSVDKTFNRSVNGEAKNYSERFYLKGNRILNDDHMWLSIFLRPVGSRYTRKERVLVCAVSLFLSMVISALWYNSIPDSDIESYFTIGSFSVTTEGLIVGSVILLFVFPVTSILSWIFKRARPRNFRDSRAIEGIEHQRFSQLMEQGYDNTLAELQCKVEIAGNMKRKETNPRNTIPWWIRGLGWIISLVLIGVSIFFVWSYGIQWGEIKTVKWFSSFLFSFFISIHIIQFFKTLLLTCISSFMKNDEFFTEDMDCDEELPSLKPDEEWNHANSLDPSFRKKVHNVEGVNYEDPRVAALRIRLFKEREMKSILRSILTYVIFLVIIYTIVNSRTDQNAYRMKTHLKNTFLKEGHLKHDFVRLIKNSNDWWLWCKQVVLQEIRAQVKYNGAQPYGLKGYLDDHANRMMGYAIIRQVRTRKGECYATTPMNKIIFNCGGIRGKNNEDNRNYCVGWNKNETFKGSCEWPEFKYESATKLHSFETQGILGNYGGGGYVLRLHGSMDYLHDRMEKLHMNAWVDQHTKALLLEFSIYNPNVNLFSTCLVIAEFKEGGGIVPHWRFEPIRLIPNSGISGTMSRIAELLFCIATILFTIRELWQIKKNGFQYFDSNWNKTEIILIIISYITIGLYFYKYLLTSVATAEFERTNGDAYIRMDEAALYDQYSLYAIGFIVFFSTLKLIKLLQFNNNMNLLALTIGRSWGELKIFLMAFAIVFFAFSCLFYFMFTSDLEQFSTIIYSVMTCFVMMMGKFDYEDMNRVNPMSPLLFFLFSVVNSFILVNLMLSIIIQSFTKLKHEMASKENRLNVIDFVWTSFKQNIRKEHFSKRHVLVNINEKKHNGLTKKEEQASELPGKVSQLLDHINQMYFDGRLNMNDPSSKSYLQGDGTADEELMGNFYKNEIKYSD